ncbi:glucuronate isomerase [candidate division KSB3 bacterium]|uniref:Uronate isomerase n=1 Tax=candidate division KSB3 bacterium TaxID=2044937 RepID=A0A2G6E562_9BACT|nr:MAG: glucuronate isomerase [candidate division KSB3 bacterium]PIE29616.1 MAG: glucuronate isomerase [candidate division KSB3 bacterium]
MEFLDDDFLLSNKTAQILYHDYAEAMPIYDYHCHLPPQDVAENRRFRNLTEIWLAGDHYKWRAMRSNGIDERLITGDAGDWEKFEAWAATVPYTVRNPLYHWTHLELKRPFGIVGTVLCPDTAQEIYERCNELLATDAFRARGIMEQMNVRIVCTTDDPIDSLEYHRQVRQDTDCSIKMLPAFRPDKAMAVDRPDAFKAYVAKLAEAANMEIRNFQSFLDAVKQRHSYFHEMGCRLSDHGIVAPPAARYTEREISAIFDKVSVGIRVSEYEVEQFQAAMMHEFGLLNAEKQWTMQIHMGAMRNNNSRMFKHSGPDSGFDSIGDLPIAAPLARFMDRLDAQEKLPKMILYVLNPRDNEVIGTMLGNFQGGAVPGKIQFGSGWWFNDQKDGMIRQMEALSNLGLLSRFVGMLTDSRSFLSYPRHEYFRRILCNLFGTDVENGELPNDIPHLGSIVQDICYNNAVNYFGIEV